MRVTQWLADVPRGVSHWNAAAAGDSTKQVNQMNISAATSTVSINSMGVALDRAPRRASDASAPSFKGVTSIPWDTAQAFSARGADPNFSGRMETFVKGLKVDLSSRKSDSYGALAHMGTLQTAFKSAHSSTLFIRTSLHLQDVA
ncbi:MAG: hypothetical protein CMO74_02860 [Verrucomicrobiales bacterium]|nr:hypothetical protein [Verrucomicrobiales bacterium]